LNRKYRSRYVTSIPFEAEIFFSVRSLLPYGVTIADVLNKCLKDKNFELQKDRNESIHSNAPVRAYENYCHEKGTLERLKPVFNIFDTKEKIIDYINSVDDESFAWSITRQAKFLVTVAEPRAKKLQKMKCLK
jgi:hypothetical protein